MEAKSGIRNSITLPTLKYASEMWTLNATQQLQICTAEMSYIREVCVIY